MEDVDPIRQLTQESIAIHNDLLRPDVIAQIQSAADLLCRTAKNGNAILVCGNGGSHAQAQHMAAELVCRFERNRRALSCYALGSNPANLSAWANDVDYDSFLERELEGMARPADTLVALSTSGNSRNIVNAVRRAGELGVGSISILGRNGGEQRGLADIDVNAGGSNTARIQEAHLLILHILCKLVENVA